MLADVRIPGRSQGARVGESGRRYCAGARCPPGHGLPWKQEFRENGPEVFGGQEEVQKFEERICQLEQMLGQKEVEIALLENVLRERELTPDERIDLIREHREELVLNACCWVLGVSKGTWHYREERRKAGPDPEEERLKVEAIIADNPASGYRRIRPELEARTGKVVSHKRLPWLLGEWTSPSSERCCPARNRAACGRFWIRRAEG